jgi:DNA-binding NtrC family response regulator
VSALPTVLVVDADAAFRRQAAAALSPDRYRVVYTGRVAEALALLRGEPVAVIVSEVALPDDSGLRLLAEARRTHPQVARVIATAVEEPDAAVQAINDAEALRFLRKPVDAPTLRAAVDDALAWAESAGTWHAARAAAERRRLTLVDLEADHPGLTRSSTGSEGYAIPRQRLRTLAERLASTPLGPLLAAPLTPPPSSEGR